MRNLEKTTTHAEDMVAQLLQQFQTGGQLEQMVQVFGERYQGLEDAGYAMISAFYLSDATGQTLDNIAQDYNLTRPLSGAAATDDEVFRVLIYAKIAEIVSYGTVPDGYNIMRALNLGSPLINNIYPAAWSVSYVPNELSIDCDCFRAIFERATLPIEIDIVMHSQKPFGFKGNIKAAGWNTGRLGQSI